MAEKVLNPLPNLKARVSFIVRANGKELDAPFAVESITIVEDFGRIASAEVVLIDGDMATGRFDLSDAEDLIVGREIEIEAGYDGKNQILFRGIIVKHAVRTNDETSVLIITAKHKAYQMTLVRRNMLFQDTTDDKIIKEIIGKYNLPVEIEATGIQHESLTQYNCNDWDFVNMRAESNAMLVYTANDMICVKKPDLKGTAKLEINNGSVIFDFEAEMDGRASFPSYKAHSWNFTNQELETVSQDTGIGDVSQGNLSSSDLASMQKSEACDIPILSSLNDKSISSSWLESVILRDNLSRITGKVTIYGFADIHPGDRIDLQRIGNRFNGKTLVSGVEHALETGSWFTVIHFGLDAAQYARKFDDIDGIKASGLLPAVNGLQIGKVVQIEDDPLGEDRILIRMPNFVSSDSTIWARVSTLDAGAERGTFFRPEVDDEVVIGFIDDNPNHAVVLGMLHSSRLPAPVKASNENALKGIYSREKLKLEFDDEKKSLLLETPGGNKLLVSDDAKGISLEDQNGNKITLNGEGIIIESIKALNFKASTDAVLEGTNVDLKAQASLTVEGSASLEVSSSGNTVVKGAIVQIN